MRENATRNFNTESNIIDLQASDIVLYPCNEIKINKHLIPDKYNHLIAMPNSISSCTLECVHKDSSSCEIVSNDDEVLK